MIPRVEDSMPNVLKGRCPDCHGEATLTLDAEGRKLFACGCAPEPQMVTEEDDELTFKIAAIFLRGRRIPLTIDVSD